MPLPPRAADRPLNAELERLLYQAKVILEEAEGLAWGLTQDQFNWRPADGSWSVGQCMDHLNMANRGFIANSEVAIRSAREKRQLSDGPFRYGWLVRWLYRQMEPPVKRRFKAPPVFDPASGKEKADVQAEWVKNHERLNELIRDANGIDLVKVKVVSPAASWLKYSIGMGLWIQCAHDRRHLWQARNVRNHPGFPG